MSNEENKVAKAAKKIATSKGGETMINLLKAGLSTFPFTGGLASLISDYIPSRKYARLEAFLEQFAPDLEELQEQVREARIQTDEFAHVFESCLRGVAENYSTEKIGLFRGILINSLTADEIDEDEQMFFLSLIGNLSTLHIKILSFITDPYNFLKARGIPETEIRGGFSTFFPIAIEGASLDTIKAAYNDLYNYGMITTDVNIFNTMTSGQGLKLLEGRVSKFGRKFINFCTA